MNILALIITIILFIIGIIGTIVPGLPGIVMIYIGMIVYGFMTNFDTLSISFFIVQGIVVALILPIDYIATAYGAKKFHGSKEAAMGSALGLLLGLIVLGPLGLIIGPFAGAIIVELIRGNTFEKSIKIGLGSFIGVLGGTILKIFAEAIMIIYFFTSIF